MRVAAVGGIVAGVLAVGSVSAAQFTYDGSFLPTAFAGRPNQSWYGLQLPSGEKFQAVAFYPATSWSTDGQVLTMRTAAGNGIWIGNIPAYNGIYSPNWVPSPALIGNSVDIRAALSIGAVEWSLYLNDGSYGGSMEFYHNKLRYWIPGPSGLQSVDHPLDATEFHNYGFLLRNGEILYRLDGATLYAGPAYASTDKSMLVGDGSGSTPTGLGSFYLDYMTINTTPQGFVPEPATLTSLSVAALLLLRRRAISTGSV